MKIVIEMESVGGVTRAKMTRGDRVWERVIGQAACNCLLRAAAAVEARAYTARSPSGTVEAAWRRVIERKGSVTTDDLVIESGLNKARAAASLRSAIQRGKLVRVGRGTYAPTMGREGDGQITSDVSALG